MIALVMLSAVLASSCRVSMVAPYDESLMEQTRQITRQVDRFYLLMQEATVNENGARNYMNYVKDYIDIEVELNDLLLKNRIKPLNSESVRNVEIALETWVNYKEMHKKNDGISDADIELNRDFLRDLFMVILIGEHEKSKIR